MPQGLFSVEHSGLARALDSRRSMGKENLGSRRTLVWSCLTVGFGIAVALVAIGICGAPSGGGGGGAFLASLRRPQKLPSGCVVDCECDYNTVGYINEAVIHPALEDLVKKPFFRYFKVKLFCDCPFWPDEGMCMLRDCSVCECPEEEFPQTFKSSSEKLSFADLKCQEGKPRSAVDKTVDMNTLRGWTEGDNSWTHDNESADEEMTYINLLLNPERYTGYVGDSAHRIWETIYNMTCLKDTTKDSCTGKRVLYRLISGLHASISTHIAKEYSLDPSTNQWQPNMTLLYDRVLKYPERVENLYFTFLFVLRALNKAAVFLSQAEYDTGNPVEDRETQVAVRGLVTSQQLLEACPVPFEEAQLWKDTDAVQLRQQIQEFFWNISSLMDCVGCERCRLWGKLQILGLDTAFRILLSDDLSVQHLTLQRNEVIALINLLARLSESVRFVRKATARI